MRLRWSRRASDDLRSILAYIDERSPSGSRNVRRTIQHCVDLIARHPELGRDAGEGDARALPVGRYPYLVYWSSTGGQVVILHIRHAARERPGMSGDE